MTTTRQFEEAIRNIAEEWTAYIGHDDTEGHDDPVPVGEAVADALRLIDHYDGGRHDHTDRRPA